MAAAEQQALWKAEVEMAPKTFKGPSKELRFLSTWWTGDSVMILPCILRKTEHLQMPHSKKE